MKHIFNIIILLSIFISDAMASDNNIIIFSSLIVVSIIIIFLCYFLADNKGLIQEEQRIQKELAESKKEYLVAQGKDKNKLEKEVNDKNKQKENQIRERIKTEQKKLEDEILLEMAKGITKKALKTINPMNLIKAKDKFVQGFEDYLGYDTVYSIDDIMAFKHLIEKIKEKCAKTGLDPYSIEPQDIVKCVYIIMSRAEIIAKKNQRIFADFNFKEVFATQSSSYDIRGDYDDIATHKKFTYIYAKNELDDIINDEIRKFIEKFSNKN